MCFAFLQADSEFIQTFLHFYPVLVQFLPCFGAVVLHYFCSLLFLTCPDLESPEKLCLYPDRAILVVF